MNLYTPLMDAIFADYCSDFKRESSVNNMIWIIEGVIQDILLGYFAPPKTTNTPVDQQNPNNQPTDINPNNLPPRIDTSQPLYPPHNWIVVGPNVVSAEEFGTW